MAKQRISENVGVFATTVYIASVGLWLVATKQIPSAGLGKTLKACFLPAYSGPLVEIREERGHCWVAAVPDHLLSDLESISRLKLFEDGMPLGPAHSAHTDIRELGGGRFSHWGALVYFSTSDHSDPRTNGKRYTVKEIR